jgi:hypothetical protein
MTHILSDRLLTCRGNKMALPCRVKVFQGVWAVGFLSLGPGHEQEDETDTYSGLGNEKAQFEPAGPAEIAEALRGNRNAAIAHSAIGPGAWPL